MTGRPAYIIAVDIGGTFTDVCIADSVTRHPVHTAKLLSTPNDIGRAAKEAFVHALSLVEPEADVSFRHAMTVVSNMLLEGTWSKVGMLTTLGFRDVIELNRQVRPDPFDLFFTRPKPLIERRHRIGVRERIAADGSVITALDESGVAAAADQLVGNDGVEAIVVCFLNSYSNPDHEDAAEAIITRRWPEVRVVKSADVVPVRGEHERFMTASVSSCTLPKFATYVSTLGADLEQHRPGSRLFVMRSNGRLTTSDLAQRRSVDFCESGPAAGVVGAEWLAVAESDGFEGAITLDIGGTTAKVAVVRGDRAEVTTAYSVGGDHHGRTLGVASGGYKVATPVLDLIEIGAGGGSILWVDDGGALRVGPRSAGAAPGPICYGRGGIEPTLTDALVVSGVYSPLALLGGELEIDSAAAEWGLSRLGATVSATAHEVAAGAIRVAAASMMQALRSVTVERGLDPSAFRLMAFGGVGPTFGALLAAGLGVRKVIIPWEAGVFSAWGLTAAKAGTSRTAAIGGSLEQADVRQLIDLFERLEHDSAAELQSVIGPDAEDSVVRRILALRYIGQSYELEIDVSATTTSDADGTLSAIEQQFNDEHERRYGFSHHGSRVEMVSARVEIDEAMQIRTPTQGRQTGAAIPVDDSTGRQRELRLFDGFQSATIVDQTKLNGSLYLANNPVVIERYDCTVLIPPGWSFATGGGQTHLYLLAPDE